MDFENEVKYFSKFYMKKGNLKEIFGFNSDLAEKNRKINVSLLWKNLLKIFYPQKSTKLKKILHILNTFL